MNDDGAKRRRALDRIADALGADRSTFFGRNFKTPEQVEEVLALLTVFESITDPDDRRACLNFVRSVAVKQRRMP